MQLDASSVALQALGAALQYAVLAVFVWTLAQAVYLYLSLVVVLFSFSAAALWIATGLSWGACHLQMQMRASHCASARA